MFKIKGIKCNSCFLSIMNPELIKALMYRRTRGPIANTTVLCELNNKEAIDRLSEFLSKEKIIIVDNNISSADRIIFTFLSVLLLPIITKARKNPITAPDMLIMLNKLKGNKTVSSLLDTWNNQIVWLII